MTTPAQISAYKQLLACQKEPLTIYSLRRLLMMLTRFHWAAPQNHAELADTLGCFHYNLEEPSEGNLAIELAARFNPEADKPKDSIYIGLASAPLRKMSIGDLAEISEDRATRRYGWVRECNLRLTHVFTDPDIGTLAAESTESFLAGVMRPVMAATAALRWEMQGIGEPRNMLKNPKSLYGVDVKLQISFNWGVDVTPESHLLKEIISNATTHTAP